MWGPSGCGEANEIGVAAIHIWLPASCVVTRLPTLIDAAGGSNRGLELHGTSFLPHLKTTGKSGAAKAVNSHIYSTHTSRGSIACAQTPYPIRAVFNGRFKYAPPPSLPLPTTHPPPSSPPLLVAAQGDTF